jgi:hypothetical protein
MDPPHPPPLDILGQIFWNEITDFKNCDIQPVFITTLGGFHKSALDFVHKILKNAPVPNKSQLFFAKMSELSIALMKDNASIVQKAFGLA